MTSSDYRSSQSHVSIKKTRSPYHHKLADFEETDLMFCPIKYLPVVSLQVIPSSNMLRPLLLLSALVGLMSGKHTPQPLVKHHPREMLRNYNGSTIYTIYTFCFVQPGTRSCSVLSCVSLFFRC